MIYDLFGVPIQKIRIPTLDDLKEESKRYVARSDVERAEIVRYLEKCADAGKLYMVLPQDKDQEVLYYVEHLRSEQFGESNSVITTLEIKKMLVGETGI